jgi:hypothetical protein
MSKYKKHHFLPRFYINNWNKPNGLVTIFLKENPPRSFEVLSKDICFDKNLYTKSRGRLDVETDFLSQVDGNAAIVMKKIIENGIDSLDINDREQFAIFINTLHPRSPEFVKDFRDFNEVKRIEGAKWAEKVFQENGEDLRAGFVKQIYDDTPFLIELNAKDENYETILNSNWEIVSNATKNDFLTSDFPLVIFDYSINKFLGSKLPEKFLMILPISPEKLFTVSNEKYRVSSITSNLKDFITKTNDVIINSAKKIIISRDKSAEYFIKKRLALLKIPID